MKRIMQKLKQIHFKELIVAIPPELKVQFNQMQLKNNLFRLKLLGIITVLFKSLSYFLCKWKISLERNPFISKLNGKLV